jgi:ribosomal-protein-alanine N-acetyltransferase
MRFAQAPHVDGAAVTLRPLEVSDIAAWYDYLALPHVVQHTSWNLKSADDLRPMIDWYNADEPASAIRFAIVPGEGGPLIGTIGFHTISRANRSAEMAYDVHPAHWGRGIATACCRALVDWGFAQRHYVRIQATALQSNAASLRVLEKCGFAREGLLRNLRIVRGEPRDFWLYATVPKR